MNPYQRMHASRSNHIELARRAMDYQAALAEEEAFTGELLQEALEDERNNLEAAFTGGLFYGTLIGAFLATLIATVAGWWH